MTRRHINVYIISVVGLACGTGLCGAQQENPTLDQILRAWKIRQDKATTAAFELTSENTIHKGSVTLMANASGLGPKTPAGAALDPPEDYTVKGTIRISLSGSKMRFSDERPVWDSANKRLYDQHHIDTFDGQLSKVFRNPMSGKDDYPFGRVAKAKKSDSANQFPLAPLIWTIRGAHPQFYDALGQLEVTGRTTTVAGRLCLEVVTRSTSSSSQREVFYLDQERDFVVVRNVTIVADLPTWQVDATYVPDPKLGWVPQSWEYIIRVAKQVQESGRRTIAKYEIGPALEGDEFDIRFPPKTLVMDTSSGQNVQYVIKENEEKGRIILSEKGPTYEELSKSDRGVSRYVVIGGLAVLFSLLIGGWIRFRRRRKQRVAGA